MRPINEQQQEHARNLFFQSGNTRAQIAEAVGVSERTISLWTKAGDWKRLRSASKRMPSLIVENFYSQVQELNDNIRNREPGLRFPTLQEAEVCRKLVLTAERMKKRNTQSEYIEMFQKFLEWLTPQNHEHLQLFTPYADRFLKSRSVDGFHPYDIEYAQPEPPLPKDPEPPTSRHPELVSGTSPNTEPLAPENSPLGRGQGDVEPGPAPQPDQDPQQEPIVQKEEVTGNNSEQSYEAPTATPAENHQPKQEIINEQGKQEISNDTSLSFGEGRGEASLAQDIPEVTPSPLVEKGKGDEVEIGYLGQRQRPQPGDNVMITLPQQDDPDIQRFSIGNAIYYIRKKD